MSAQPACVQTSSNVHQLGEAVISDAKDWPLIPDGAYQARYLKHECIHVAAFGKQPKVFVHFQIVEPGGHFGKVLYASYRVQKLLGAAKPGVAHVNGRFALRKNMELTKMLCRVLDVRV